MPADHLCAAIESIATDLWKPNGDSRHLDNRKSLVIS
jgi:hypothetical protein